MSDKETKKVNAIPKMLWLILGVTFIVFARVLNAGFVNFDDDVMLYNNPLITSLSWDNISTYFSNPVAGIYQPLTMLSLSIDYAIAGLSPKYFHFINLIMHLINVLLVFKLVASLAKNERIALIVAVLFGVHTLHVESVAWITERKDVLYTMFYLLGLLKFVRYLDLNEKKQLIWTFVFFVFACLSKPMAVSFALVLPLIHFYKGNGLKEWFRPKNWMVYAPFLLTSLYFGLMIYGDQQENVIGHENQFQGWGRQLVFAGDALTTYLLRIIMPVGLSVIYEYPANIGESIPVWSMVKAFTGLLWVVASFWLLAKNKGLAFGALFFLVNVMFVLQIVPMGVGYKADRFVYLASIGLFWMIAIGLDQLVERKALSLSTSNYSVGAYVVLLSVLTLVRTGVWKDGISLWDATIEKNQNSFIAYNNRGELYMETGQWYDAINDFTNSLKLSETGKAYYNRGTTFAKIMSWKNAELDLMKAVELDSTNGDAYGNLGVVYMNTQHDSLALINLTKAVELSPNNAKHQANLDLLKSFMNNN